MEPLGLALPMFVVDPKFLRAMKKTGAVLAPKVLFPGKWGRKKKKCSSGFVTDG